MSEITTAARDVLAERERQKSKEGWTPQHDDEHCDGELSRAAACYAVPSLDKKTVAHHHEWSGNARYDDSRCVPVGSVEVPVLWPDWDGQWWKPKDRRRDLVRAGALILAEIERLDRAAVAGGD